MNNRGYKVKPRTTANIRKIAQGFKDVLKINKSYVPIVKLIEILHQKGIIELEIVAKDDMPDEYGLSHPATGLIKIREDVYDKAVEGDGFARFTIAHEIGHFMLHRKQASYARSIGGKHKVYEDSEWQADKFAQELLIDERTLKNGATTVNIESEYGVSGKAAKISLRALTREGVIKNAPLKKGH